MQKYKGMIGKNMEDAVTEKCSSAEMSKELRIEEMESYLREKFHLPKEQVAQMIPSFIDTLASHMKNVESALEDDDLRSLGRAGHTIKGALLNLGLHDCAEIAVEIELKGKEHDAAVDYQALVSELRTRLNSLIC